MNPNEREALKRAGWATLVLVWLIWAAWPLSRETAGLMAVAWLLLVGWILEGGGG